MLQENIQTQTRETLPQTISQTVHPYPLLTIAQTIPDAFSAYAMGALDAETKTVVLKKNADIPLPMASTTKIMTALTALNHYQPTDVLTIQSEDIEGAAVGFKKRDKVTFMDVMYGMLLPSGNDAAQAIADNYPGGEAAFVAQMNENAKQLYLLNTYFADPTGLNDEQNYASAHDLAILGAYALQNKTFAQIVATKTKTITTVDKTATYQLKNLNKLLGTDGIIGIKTGFTEKAGEVLVTAQKQNGHTLIVVVMKSRDRFNDTKDMLSMLQGGITYQSFDTTFLSNTEGETIQGSFGK